MRAVEVLYNLKCFNAWEYSSYSMNKEEADVCIEALEVYIEWMEEKKKDAEQVKM